MHDNKCQALAKKRVLYHFEFASNKAALPTNPKRGLRQVGVESRRGGAIGIVGPGGSGKSTLVSHIKGFHRPAGGRILPDGFDMNEIDLHVSLLGHWGRLKWKQDEQGLNVKLPDTPSSASPVALKIKGVV